MKNIIKYTFAAVTLLTLATGCSEGYIDDISQVAAGEDKAAPTITITNPPSGTINIPFTDTSTNYTFEFKASDDNELKNISISLDGSILKTYADFLDYRNYTGSYLYNNLGLGNHTFKVDATDLSGKVTTKTFAFNVTNVYQPFNAGEVFFVPFDNPSTDPLKIASDQLQNTMATNNPFSSVAGINGNGVKGSANKFISYTKPNNWYADAKALSVSVWFKSDADQTKNNIGTNGPEHIFSTPSSNGHWSASQSALFLEGSKSACAVKFLVVDKNVGDKFVTWEGAESIAGIIDQKWHHLAITYDNATSKFVLYIDGKANTNVKSWDNHGDINFNPATASSFRIGAGPQDNFSSDDWLSSSFKGSLDQFRLFTTPLSPTEVTTLFDSKL